MITQFKYKKLSTSCGTSTASIKFCLVYHIGLENPPRSRPAYTSANAAKVWEVTAIALARRREAVHDRLLLSTGKKKVCTGEVML